MLKKCSFSGIGIIILIFMTVALLSACNNNAAIGDNSNTETNSPNYNVPYKILFSDGYNATTLPIENKVENVNAILNSEQDLISFSKENRFPFYEESSAEYNRKLSQTVRKYEKSYFNKKSMLFMINNELGEVIPQINHIDCIGKTLKVSMQKPSTVENSDAISTFVYLVEINKLENDIKDISLEIEKSGDVSYYNNLNYNAEIFDLDYVYNKGILTKENISDIVTKFNNEKNNSDKSLEALNEDLKSDIINVYANYAYDSIAYMQEKYGFSLGNVFDKESIKIVGYYGNYNNCHAVLIKYDNKMNLYPEKSEQVLLGDMIINYQDSARLFVYKEGKI